MASDQTPPVVTGLDAATAAPVSALLRAERRCTDIEHINECDLFSEELHMLALWYELKKLRAICRRALAYGLNAADCYSAHEASEAGKDMRKVLNEPGR